MSSIAKRPDGSWRARYRDAAGREHSKHHARKVDAQRWLDEATAGLVTGQWVDPRGGRITFKEYAETWRAVQVHRPSSAAHVETMLRRHAYPVLGDLALASIVPSKVQAWVKGMTLAPSTVGVVHGIVAGIFRAAVRDRRIATNPCEGTKLPRKQPVRVEPLSLEQVVALTRVAPPAWRAAVVLGAGAGLRNGEMLGLTLDRVDFLRRTLLVDRQLVTVAGQAPAFGPPKTSASVRTIPLPPVVGEALARHVENHGTGPDGLLFVSPDGRPVTRTLFGHMWRPVVTAAKVPAGTRYHDLRHHYASLLIRHGESVKTVQARLGHASAAETLDTYSHLWPDSDDRTRDAVQGALGAALAAPADHVRTDGVVT